MKIMKKILSVVAVTAALTACNSNPKTGSDAATSLTVADTATLNHNAFTDKAQEVQLNGVNDTIVTNDGNTYVKVKPKEAAIAPVTTEKSEVRHTVTNKKTGSKGNSAGTAKSESTTVSNKTSGSSNTETTTTAAKKPKWSKAAKGTVIGAGTGAAAGAIISKKKGKGAIIGGIIGGAGGYIIGRNKDKKDGRY